nr:MFS transporter [Acuticoccus kalidii]
MPNRRLALLSAAIFFESGIYLPFFSIWLNARALDPGEIGIILAAPLIAKMLASPAITTIADRVGAIAPVLWGATIVFVFVTVALGFAHGFWPILVLVVVMGLAKGPFVALSDAVTWRHLRLRLDPALHEHRYGRIRLWGSVGFIAANLVAGQFLGLFDAGALIWLILAAGVVASLSAFSLVRVPERDVGAVNEPAVRSGAIGPIAVLIAGTAMIQATHAMYYSFGSLHWAEIGYSGEMIGALWAGSVVAEVLFFLYARPIAVRIGGPFALISLGAAMAIGRWAAMSFDPGIAVLVLLQFTHAITFGATHLGAMMAIAYYAPAGMEVRAQGWLSATSAAMMAGFTTLSGLLYGAQGEATYWLMAALAAIGLIVVARARRMALAG